MWDEQVYVAHNKYSNYWMLPGGRREFGGESTWDCATREFLEECQIDIKTIYTESDFKQYNVNWDILIYIGALYQ